MTEAVDAERRPPYHDAANSNTRFALRLILSGAMLSIFIGGIVIGFLGFDRTKIALASSVIVAAGAVGAVVAEEKSFTELPTLSAWRPGYVAPRLVVRDGVQIFPSALKEKDGVDRLFQWMLH